MTRGAYAVTALLAALIWLVSDTRGQQPGQTGAKPQESGQAGRGEGAAQEPPALCPSGDEPIDEASYTYYRGKRVYFCCDGCRGKFEKEPEKYLDGVKKQWEVLKPLRVQVLCPVHGKPIDAKLHVETPDERLYFCSEECRQEWQKDRAKYQAKLAACYTFQTHCTCAAGEIDPTCAAQVDGRSVYFCCPGCRTTFEKDKAAYLKKLDAQIAANRAAWARRHAGGKPEKKGG